MSLLRHLLVSLVVGALFGWALSTRFEVYPAVISGVAAAIFMAVSLALIERAERRGRVGSPGGQTLEARDA